MIFDENLVNVGLNKPVTGSPQWVGDATFASVFTLQAGNDGILDNDATPVNMVHTGGFDGFWQVDLQVGRA